MKNKQFISILFVMTLLLTLTFPVFTADELDNAEEQQNTVFWVQTIGGILIALVIIILLIKNRSLIFRNPSSSSLPSDVPNEDKVFEKIRLSDSEFKREPFLEYAGNTLIIILNAIAKRNPSMLRKYETDYLYSIHEKQIREYIENKRTNHFENISLISVGLSDFTSGEGIDTLSVRARISLIDFTTDDVSGETLDGSRLARRNRVYKLDFIRKTGVKTKEISVCDECPACGKPLNITSTGKCAECKQILCDGSYGWILNSMQKWGREV
jgi:hypothetical protein